MNPTKNHAVNVVSKHTTKMTGNLEQVTLIRQATGERAHGVIRIHYEHLVAEIDYDTVVGPDGLRVRIDGSIGTRIKVYCQQEERKNNTEVAQLTEPMLQIAERMLGKKNVTQNTRATSCIEVAEPEELIA